MEEFPSIDTLRQPENDPLSPVGKACNICGTDYDDDDWGVMGWIGILPVSLCVDCSSGMYHMILSGLDADELEEAAMIKRMEADQ